MRRSVRAAIVIRSLRTVAVGALRIRRVSSRTALARRKCSRTPARTEALPASTQRCPGTVSRPAGDAG